MQPIVHRPGTGPQQGLPPRSNTNKRQRQPPPMAGEKPAVCGFDGPSCLFFDDPPDLEPRAQTSRRSTSR
eukprot:scaffold12408_cov112-Isochrysis_galbana.AAC.2